MGNILNAFENETCNPELLEIISELQLSQVEIETKTKESSDKLNSIRTEIDMEMLKSVRRNFNNNIQTTIINDEESVTLEFPYGMHNEHKIIVIKELLERFGKMQVKTVGTQSRIHLIKKDTEIPQNIKFIIIKFAKED